MTIKPLADRVLVLPAPAEEKVGGIIIPDTAKEKPQRGKVAVALLQETEKCGSRSLSIALSAFFFSFIEEKKNQKEELF